MESDFLQALPDGRVFIDYGPVSMVITAKREGAADLKLLAGAFPIIKRALTELSTALPKLKRYIGEIRPVDFTGLPRQMLEAVLAVGEPTMTPMASVAGAMSDLVADWLWEQGAGTVIVNNGGDIALRLSQGDSIRMGVLPDLSTGQMEEILTIRAEDGVGGVCTSGLGGRSFTRGIANAVTVFSERCIQADACATHIANVSYVPSERVQTALAGELDPASDIADLTVVTSVSVLTEEEVSRGLSQIEHEIVRQRAKGNLLYAAADIQGWRLYYPPDKKP